MIALSAKSQDTTPEIAQIIPTEEMTTVEEETSKEETIETEIDIEEDPEREETDLPTEEETPEREETIVIETTAETEEMTEEITEEEIWKEEDPDPRSVTTVTMLDTLPRIVPNQALEEDLIVTLEDTGHPEEDVQISDLEDLSSVTTATRRVTLPRNVENQERRENKTEKNQALPDQAPDHLDLPAPEAEVVTKVEIRNPRAIENPAAPAQAPALSKTNRRETLLNNNEFFHSAD